MLTMFINHQIKIFCVLNDSTAFIPFIDKCQAITLDESLMITKMKIKEDEGYSQVEYSQFKTNLPKTKDKQKYPHDERGWQPK